MLIITVILRRWLFVGIIHQWRIWVVFKMGLAKTMCRLERFISDITRIKWMRCGNCEMYEYVKVEDKIFGGTKNSLRCRLLESHTSEWQYCCEFSKRKTETNASKKLMRKLELKSAIRKHDKIMNEIYSKEDAIKGLKKDVEFVDSDIKRLKAELDE